MLIDLDTADILVFKSGVLDHVKKGQMIASMRDKGTGVKHLRFPGT